MTGAFFFKRLYRELEAIGLKVALSRLRNLHMRKKNLIAILGWFLVTGYVCFKSIELDLGTLTNPGPGFMPFLWASALGILSIFLLVKEFNQTEKEFGGGAAGWTKIIMILVGIVLYAALISKLGYLLTTFLTMVLFFKVTDSRKWLLVLLNSFLTTAVSYIIFEILLEIKFPKGILGN